MDKSSLIDLQIKAMDSTSKETLLEIKTIVDSELNHNFDHDCECICFATLLAIENLINFINTQNHLQSKKVNN